MLNTQVKRKAQSPKLKGATLLEDGSVKQLEKLMSSHPIGLEDIFMEDEEPLSEVFEKCGNLKKHDMQRLKAGEEFPKELPSSESFVEVTPNVEKKLALPKKTEDQIYMQPSSQETHCEIFEDDTTRKSPSSFLEESGTNYSERTGNQRPVITKCNGAELYSQPFEHPMDYKGGSQHEGDQHPQQNNKDDQERPLVLIEETPEDKSYLSDSHKQLLEHTSHQQHSQQLKNSPQEKRRRGRPRKSETTMKDGKSSLLNPDLTTHQISDKQNKQLKSQGRLLKEKLALKDASDLSISLQKNKSPKQDSGARTRKLRATKRPLDEQERPSKQNKELEKVGRRRPRKSKATTEDATHPRGGIMKKSKFPEELFASPRNLDCQQEVELCESGNRQQSQHQSKKLKREVAKIQKQGDRGDEALTSLSHEEQDGVCGRASEHCSVSQNRQSRNNSRVQSPVKGASRAAYNPQHVDFVEASHVSEALLAQGEVCVKDQTQARRRSTRNLEPAKPLLDSQSDKQHDLELSDQRTLARLTPALVPSDNHCSEKVPVYLENEVHGKSVEPRDDKTHTPVSNNSDDREHPEESYDHDQAQESYDHDLAQEKREVQVKVPKELTAKSVSIHVPLASRDQLRSRIKH
ncbi:hypothetical protein KSS87_015488 [Heliosperma pusillum]|nr:hypothetical protein KSS87_015488 [Heliosperma pusillum]